MSEKTYEQWLEEVKQKGEALCSVPKPMKTPELCLAAVRQTGWALGYVPTSLRTADLCLAAVQQDGWAIHHVPDAMRTPQVCLAAVQQSGESLRHVPEHLRTADLCLAAVLAYSLQNLAKTMEESIDLHQNSPFLNCRWDSVHGKVKQVELFCLPTLGEGSELYQITYESGTLMRTPAKEMVNFMKKQAYEITPEGQAEKQAKEDAYHQRVAKAEAERAAAQERLAALTGKIEGWLDTGNYTPRQRGLAIKVLSEQCQFRGEVTTRAEFVAKVIEEGHAPATHTESRIRDKSNLQWFRMTAQQQREHEKKMASGGEKTVYRLEKDFGDGTCTSFTVTKTEYEYACFLSRQPDPAPVATKQKAKSASFSM